MADGRGGDVDGTTKTDSDLGCGSPLTVAKASFDAGYMDLQKRAMPDASMAELKRGYRDISE